MPHRGRPDSRRDHADSGLTAFALMMIGLIIVSGYTSINAVVKGGVVSRPHPRAGRRTPLRADRRDFRRNDQSTLRWD